MFKTVVVLCYACEKVAIVLRQMSLSHAEPLNRIELGTDRTDRTDRTE